MFKHILIATDGSDRSDRAIRLAVDLAKSVGAKVTAIMTTWPVPPVYFEGATIPIRNEELEQNARAFAKRCLDAAAAHARAAGVVCETVHLVKNNPYEGILQTAEANHCDLIVMASHGRSGASALLLGSETHKVLAHSKLPVLVCR